MIQQFNNLRSRFFGLVGILSLSVLGSGCDKDPANTDDENDESSTPSTTNTDDSNSTDTTSPETTGDETAEGCAVAGDPASFSFDGACEPSTRIGSFRIEEQEHFSIMSGEVADGVPPLSVLQEESTFGPCKILRRPNLVCNPACKSDEVCSLEETCIPAPRNQDLGLLTIDGMNKCLELTAAVNGKKYNDNDLPHPVFQPGAIVELRTPEGPYGPLLLHGQGVEPLALVPGDWRVLKGKATSVKWVAPTVVTRAWIDLRINVDQHGLSPATIYCSVEDTGSMEIPAEAIDALYDLGVSGAPSGSLTRRTVDSQMTAGGCVDLSVGSSRTPSICINEEACD